MLLELHVRNFAIAEKLDLRFGRGFNVLTGETGAGKSIVIDSISLLIGGRGGADMIRSGSDFCRAEALFDIAKLPELQVLLEELGIEHDGDELVISREINTAGRSRCRVNGRLTTVANLGRLGEHLVDIHGQHDHQSLLHPDRHLDWLDAYAGPDIADLVEDVAKRWREYRQTVRTLVRWDEESRERERRRDLLQFQLDEIDRCNLKLGEDEELLRMRERLANAERLLERMSGAYSLLMDGEPEASAGLDLLGEATELLNEAQAWEPELAPIVELLESAQAQVQEAAHMLRQQRDLVQADPRELAAIEERLSMIAQLRRKYGPDVAAILSYRDEIEAELNEELSTEAAYDDLLRKRDRLEQELVTRVTRLSELRRSAGDKLSREMKSELSALALESAEFSVSIRNSPSDTPEGLNIDGQRYSCSERGLDRVEFMFSANPGETARPLAKVASGGELSRMMLALKSLMARHDQVPTLIFDEVDAGIGGRTASAVGQRVARLASQHQVLVVTHLAQIACVANEHLHVEKQAVDGRTNTKIRVLSDIERVAEIARMLDGTTSETTLQRAQELLNSAKADNPKKAV